MNTVRVVARVATPGQVTGCWALAQDQEAARDELVTGGRRVFLTAEKPRDPIRRT